MRLLFVAGIVGFFIAVLCLASIVLTVSDTCGNDTKCRVEMEAPQ